MFIQIKFIWCEASIIDHFMVLGGSLGTSFSCFIVTLFDYTIQISFFIFLKGRKGN